MTESSEQENAPRWSVPVLDPAHRQRELLVIAAPTGVLLIGPTGDAACIVPPKSVGPLRDALRDAEAFNDRRERRIGGTP